MASVAFRRLLLSSSRLERTVYSHSLRPTRNAVTSATGGVLSKPSRSSSYAVVKIAIVVTPFLTIGAYIGKFFAEKMEELDVFVPDDDDDDD